MATAFADQFVGSVASFHSMCATIYCLVSIVGNFKLTDAHNAN